MEYLKFDTNTCKDCFTCLRNCPVRAIKFVDQKPQIVSDLCILCGKCVTKCPKNAKKVVSHIDEVKQLIKDNPNKVALSVAPSFVANFKVGSFASFKKACEDLGFSIVEETARGAYYVTKEYGKLLDSGKYPVLITSACPSSVTYLCTEYPEAIKYLAPVVSPMVAHARILKKEHGDDLKVVFVGPCIAKKKEADQHDEVNYVLTFEELLQMFNENNIQFEEIADEDGAHNPARYYPINRGVLKSFGLKVHDDYDSIAIDGEETIKERQKNAGCLCGRERLPLSPGSRRKERHHRRQHFHQRRRNACREVRRHPGLCPCPDGCPAHRRDPDFRRCRGQELLRLQPEGSDHRLRRYPGHHLRSRAEAGSPAQGLRQPAGALPGYEDRH